MSHSIDNAYPQLLLFLASMNSLNFLGKRLKCFPLSSPQFDFFVVIVRSPGVAPGEEVVTKHSHPQVMRFSRTLTELSGGTAVTIRFIIESRGSTEDYCRVQDLFTKWQ